METELQWGLGRLIQTLLYQGSRLGALEERVGLSQATQSFWGYPVSGGYHYGWPKWKGGQSGGNSKDALDDGIVHLLHQSV